MSDIITEQVFGGKIQEMVMLYDYEIAHAKVAANELAKLPINIYRSLTERDDDLDMLPDETPNSLNIHRVMKYRIRSRYWLKLIHDIKLIEKVNFNDYKSVWENYDSNSRLVIPDFTVQAIEDLLIKYEIKI
jgi:hypothetical protein